MRTTVAVEAWRTVAVVEQEGTKRVRPLVLTTGSEIFARVSQKHGLEVSGRLSQRRKRVEKGRQAHDLRHIESVVAHKLATKYSCIVVGRVWEESRVNSSAEYLWKCVCVCVLVVMCVWGEGRGGVQRCIPAGKIQFVREDRLR